MTSVIWIPCGKLFCCRLVHDCGVVSGPSNPIEPDRTEEFRPAIYGSGVFCAPDDPYHQLLVTHNKADLPPNLRRRCVRDSYNRLAVEVRLDPENPNLSQARAFKPNIQERKHGC